MKPTARTFGDGTSCTPRKLASAALAAASLTVLTVACGAHRAAPPATTTARRPPARPLVHKAAVPHGPAERLLGLPPVPRGPVPGYVLIADRNNDRLLIVSPAKRIVWTFPRSGDVRPGQSFHDPDDAFFTPGYRRISINEEFNETASIIDVHTHRIVWSFGHAGIAGSSFGYLSNPDDAYVLRNGDVMVADIRNCRVLFINHAKHVVREIGHAGSCTHDPPRGLSSPNGDTPLADGGVLVTEIGGWVDRLSRSGRLLYSIRTPTTYPSDAQLLPNGNVLVAGFDTPGRVDELTPSGRIVWTYGPSSGPGALDRPSLAVRWPNGMIAVTDDWHHRVVVINPKTKRIVWSYGHDGSPGSSPGYLDKPDGLDLLPATITGRRQRRTAGGGAEHLIVRRVGTLPAALSRASAVALPHNRILVAGGLVAGSSTDAVLTGTPERLKAIGRLPVAGHDAAAVRLGGKVEVFGGGQSVSTNGIVSVDPSTGRTALTGHLPEPLSDLGAVVVRGHAYLVGGYTGTRYAAAVVEYRGAGKITTVARLPSGLRYAGVAAIGGTIYVAGGLTTAGETDRVYAVVPATGSVRQIATLPNPRAYGALVAFHQELLFIGGKSDSGVSSDQVLRIDQRTGHISLIGRLPHALAEPAAVARSSDVVVIGGEGSSAIYSFGTR